MKRLKTPALFILFVLSVFFSPRCEAADKLTMSSTNPTALEIDQMTAREKGFFARENIELDVTYMQPNLVIKTLIAGTVDLARSGTHFGVIPATRGTEIKIIGGPTYGYPYQVINFSAHPGRVEDSAVSTEKINATASSRSL